MARSAMIKRLTGITLTLLLCGAASGYYHFVHYRYVDGQLVTIPEKFDLSKLPANTVQYFLSPQGPEQLADGDSLQAVVSEIQMAAATWDSVATSQLRLRFGGFRDINDTQDTPSIDIVFDEMPPGLVALGGPTVRAEEVVDGPQGQFVPVLRSIVKLNKDLTSRPSYSERFFLTVVHELGHTLGLQHTLTSSVMSTEITRATTKAQPLDIDDTVGVSLLYPAPNFLLRQASISGRVTLNGEGVHLASVVALGTARSAVSTLTLPDGSFHLEGLPAGYYYIYVHPLPPAVYGEVSPANLVLPLDEDGNPVQPGANFALQFYGGTGSGLLYLGAGSKLNDVDFAVSARPWAPVHSVQTYSFYTTEAVKPGYFTRATGTGFLLASGAGLVSDGNTTSGLRVSVLNGGDYVQGNSVKPYTWAPSFLQMNVMLYPLGGFGARHLLFSVGDDGYVLPNAYRIVAKLPPVVSSVVPNPDEEQPGTAVITGSNLDASTRVLFDGAEAPILSVGEDSVTVKIPPAVSQHQARVVALNPDGQSSLFMQGASAPVYQYGEREPSTLVITPSTLRAGVEQLVEITGENTDFADGEVAIGFGNSDIVVERSWVTSSGSLLANIYVAPATPAGQYSLSLTSALNLVSLPLGVTVEQAQADVPTVSSELVNVATGQSILYAGATAKLTINNLPAPAPAEPTDGETAEPAPATPDITVTVSGSPAAVQSVQDGVATILLPEDLPLGPVSLVVTVGGSELPPVAIVINRQPPSIVAVRQVEDETVTADHPALISSYILIDANDLVPVEEGQDPPELSTGRFQITFGDVPQSVERVTPVDGQPGVYSLMVLVSQFVTPGDNVPVTLWFDGQPSAPVTIPVIERPPDNPAPEFR